MRGVGVLVGVAVSGVAGAWITKLVVGSVTAPLFFFDAEEAPTLTPHWKLVLVGGGLLEAWSPRCCWWCSCRRCPGTGSTSARRSPPC